MPRWQKQTKTNNETKLSSILRACWKALSARTRSSGGRLFAQNPCGMDVQHTKESNEFSGCGWTEIKPWDLHPYLISHGQLQQVRSHPWILEFFTPAHHHLKPFVWMKTYCFLKVQWMLGFRTKWPSPGIPPNFYHTSTIKLENFTIPCTACIFFLAWKYE